MPVSEYVDKGVNFAADFEFFSVFGGDEGQESTEEAFVLSGVWLGLRWQGLTKFVESKKLFLAGVEIDLSFALQFAELMQELSSAIGDWVKKMFSEGGQMWGSFDGRYIFWWLFKLLEDVDNGEGIVSLMFLEFADAADRYFFLARAVKADAGEGLLGVAFDGAGWVFEGACIHKRIRVELDYFENITYMNQKKEGVDEKEKTKAAVFI